MKYINSKMKNQEIITGQNCNYDKSLLSIIAINIVIMIINAI